MAAGLTLAADQLPTFIAAFEAVIAEHDDSLFAPVLLTDGVLAADQLSLGFAQQLLTGGPWGQGFAAPVFEGQFAVLEQRWLQGKHIKWLLRPTDGGAWVEAIWFNADPAWPESASTVYLAYQLDINHFRGERRLQLMVQHVEPLA